MKNFFWVVILAFLVGCEKDENEVKVIDAPKVYFANRGIVVEWEPADISGFKSYRVLRSTDGQNFYVISPQSIFDSTYYDVNHTTYTEIAYPFVDSIYYKIEILGNQRIESPKVGLAIPAPMELDYDPSAGFVLPGREEILFFKGYDDRGTRFSLYDYKNGIKKKELKLDVEVSGFSLGFGKFNGNYECYFHDFTKPQMDIYDATNFNYKASFDFDRPYSYVVSDFSNYLYYPILGDIAIVNRNNLTTEVFDTGLNTNYDKVYFMEGQNKLIGFYFSNGVSIFELGPTGNITNHIHKEYSKLDVKDYIEGTKYIYAESLNSFKIINTENWEEKNLLNEKNQTFFPSILHAKNGVLYAVDGNRIYCYSLDNLKLIEYFPARVSPYMVLSDDKDLILISRTFGHTAVIDKMKLSQ